MLVQVDFYKRTGKWYSGGEVEVSKMPWEDGILEEIIKNQNILIGTEEFIIVVNDLSESMVDRNYRYTYARLYMNE